MRKLSIEAKKIPLQTQLEPADREFFILLCEHNNTSGSAVLREAARKLNKRARSNGITIEALRAHKLNKA